VTLAVNKVTLVRKQNKGKQAALSALEQQIAKLEKLKLQYSLLIDAEDKLLCNLQARVQHLAQLENVQIEGDDYQKELLIKEFFETKLNRLILEYLQRQGYSASAALFTDYNELEAFSDDHVYRESSLIVHSLTQMHNCELALAWCHTNKTKL